MDLNDLAKQTGLSREAVEAALEDDEALRQVQVPDDCGCCGTTEYWLDGPAGSVCVGQTSGAF